MSLSNYVRPNVILNSYHFRTSGWMLNRLIQQLNRSNTASINLKMSGRSGSDTICPALSLSLWSLEAFCSLSLSLQTFVSFSLSIFIFLPSLCLHVSWIRNQSLSQCCRKAINIPQSLHDSKQALTNPKKCPKSCLFPSGASLGKCKKATHPSSTWFQNTNFCFLSKAQRPPTWYYLLVLRQRDKSVKETSKIR